MNGIFTSKNRGFTIVEILIVIVVVGILASISVVAYQGIRERATNASVMSEFRAWKQAFALYYGEYGRYPIMPDNTHYCLGTGFPDGKCRDYKLNNTNTYTEAASEPLMTELKKVIEIPSGPKYPVNGTVGPYATFNQSNNGFVGMTIVLYGSSGDCPNQTNYIWDDGNGRLLCEYAFPLT